MAFSLVRWISGKDIGKYTVLNTSWIKGFDPEKYKNEGLCDESYIIEWQEGKKPPLGGWPVYDGTVIEISDNINKLNRILENVAPLKNITNQQKSVPAKRKIGLGGVNMPKTNIKKASNKENLDKFKSLSTIKHKEFGNLDKNRETLYDMQNEKDVLTPEETDTDVNLIQENSLSVKNAKLLHEIEELRIENTQLRAINLKFQENIFQEIPELVVAVKDLKAHIVTAAEQSVASAAYSSSSTLAEKSNYKGGKSKHTTVNGPDCREGIDKTIMDAIYKCTMKEYPMTKKQDFGKGVNAKLTNMHYKAKQESFHPSSGCEMSEDSN